MPKLWDTTIEAHRRELREAVLDTTAALVAKHGLLSLTMSAIAEETGIGRATLYKYFPDVESILFAWHERQVDVHLQHIAQLKDQPGRAGDRLKAVLQAYAQILHESHGHEDTAFVALLHRDHQVLRAENRLHDLIRDLLVEAASEGDIRSDVAPDELASFGLHAIAAASVLRSKAAVQRLITLVLAGLGSRAPLSP